MGRYTCLIFCSESGGMDVNVTCFTSSSSWSSSCSWCSRFPLWSHRLSLLLLPVFRTISLALLSRWTRPTGFFSSVHQRTPPPQKPERDAADAPDCDWRTSGGLKNSGDTKSQRTRSVLPDVSGSSPWSPVLLHGAVRSRRICWRYLSPIVSY